MRKRKKLKVAFLVLAALVAVIVGYAVYAGKVVSDRMSFLQWELPSRVLAAAPILYPGSPFVPGDFRTYANRLGYRKVPRAKVGPGQFFESGGTVIVGVRSFRDPVGEHKSAKLKIDHGEGKVRALAEIRGGEETEIFTASLEPERLGEIYSSRRQNRTLVKLRDVPQNLVRAILLMEDRRFYGHHGVSFRGILRAMWRNARGGQVAEGGSTLTQQLMKNFFLSPDRTLGRKVKELVMTLVAEALYSKDEILEAYLNEIYLGQSGSTSIHGFGEASRFYFSEDLDRTSLAEQALLAGLISSPGRYSPYRDPKAAAERKLVVLGKLREAGDITAEEYGQAKGEPLEARGRFRDERFAPYFLDYVQAELSDRFDPERLKKEGFEIHTTLDPALQRLAERAVEQGLPRLGKRAEGLEVALLAVQPGTGAVKAMLGGRNYGVSQFNRSTQAERSIGSLVKPFISAVALRPGENGGPPAASAVTQLEDRPATFSFEGKDWQPQNYEKRYFGTVTLRTALENSLNLATVNLASRIPLEDLVSALHSFGFESARALPAITLGALSSTPWAVARAYCIFPNGGLLPNLQGVSAVIGPGGDRAALKSMEVHEVLPPEAAFLITYLLQGVVDRGTGRSVRSAGLSGILAGKTGTTDDFRDSWFVGFSPSLVTVVWVGKDDDTSTVLSGAAGALPIWIRFMKEALQRVPEGALEPPAGVVFGPIDRIRGCRGGTGETLQEAFLPGTEPPACR